MVLSYIFKYYYVNSPFMYEKMAFSDDLGNTGGLLCSANTQKLQRIVHFCFQLSKLE